MKNKTTSKHLEINYFHSSVKIFNTLTYIVVVVVGGGGGVVYLCK